VRAPVRLAIALGCAAVAVVLAVALVGGGDPVEPAQEPAPTPSAADTTPFLGIVNERLIALPPDELEETLERHEDLGIGLVRQTFDWAVIEPERGAYDLTAYDALMEGAARRGVEVLPVLFNPPAFRSAQPRTGAARGTYPPRRYADMGEFAGMLVRRYGPGGSFWLERPELEALPLRAWQVWNEPSLPAFWPEGPQAREYARLLAATAEGIRAADPEALVVTAGLPETDNGVPFERFVAGLYRAGADEAFDVLAIHPYARSAEDTIRAVARARKIMDRRGDDSPLWVTEIGWASGGPPSSFTVGRRGQARRVRDVLVGLARRAEELRLRGVVYFNWQDGTVYEGGTDFWGLHTGLLPLTGAPKPAYRAFEEAAAEVIREVR
jgi:polysaccharide biosynthesis protein PslG